MNTYFLVFDSISGKIKRQGNISTDMVAAQAVYTDEAAMEIASSLSPMTDYYILSDTVTPRPTLSALPATKALGAGVDWSIGGIPEDTEVYLDSVLSGTVDNTGLVLSFPTADTWLVELKPPFPYLNASCEVTVS